MGNYVRRPGAARANPGVGAAGNGLSGRLASLVGGADFPPVRADFCRFGGGSQASTVRVDNGFKEVLMAVRVAINGFGRTGRAAFRAAYER